MIRCQVALLVFTLAASASFGQIISLPAATLKAAHSIGSPKGGSLKLLTWNLHLLPAIVPGKHQKQRAKAIAEVLSESKYDVIVFQEAFHNRARKLIWNVLSEYYSYQYGPGKSGIFKFSSGVWIISKLELKKKEMIAYSKCNRGSADCRARKGAVFVQIEKNGMLFQIIGTHLQAKEGNEFQDVRNDQLKEIRDLLILKNKEERTPFIVTGDLNISMAKTADYEQMLSILDVENGALSGDNKFTADKTTNDMYPSEEYVPKVIDYVFINKMNAKVEEVKREVKIFRKNWHKKYKDLSDHYAVEAEIVY